MIKVVSTPVYLSVHPDTLMAQIRMDGKQMFLGNYWDFHPGCHGPISGITDFNGPEDLAQQLAAKFKKTMIKKIRKNPFRC